MIFLGNKPLYTGNMLLKHYLVFLSILVITNEKKSKLESCSFSEGYSFHTKIIFIRGRMKKYDSYKIEPCC